MITARIQLILLVANHNVTKNLTGHRMHVEGPQIYQMNRQTNSFLNMCDMLGAKIDGLSRKRSEEKISRITKNKRCYKKHFETSGPTGLKLNQHGLKTYDIVGTNPRKISLLKMFGYEAFKKKKPFPYNNGKIMLRPHVPSILVV